MAKTEKATFEELLRRLQTISETLDKNDTGLEDSVKLFEEGIQLTKECYARLGAAEVKVTELKNDLEKSIKIDVQQD